jgi:hypothetical protein
MPHNSSISRIRSSWLALGLLFATPAFAHDTLPAEWCLDPNTSPVETIRFDFTPAALASYRERNPILTDPPADIQCTDVRSCGIVDDWFWANQMAQQFCAGSQSQPVALRATDPKTQTPIAIVSAPLEFNARDHHDRYRFRDNQHLVGFCVACLPPKATPAPEEPMPPGDPISH